MARYLALCLVLILAAACSPRLPAPPERADAVFVPPADAPAEVVPTLIEGPAAVEPRAVALPSTATAPDMAGSGAGPSATAEQVDQAVAAAVESLGIEPKPPADAGCLLSPAAFDLIVAFETGGRRAYDRKYQRPVWPGASSGATIGIGYDLGHATKPVILMDWPEHPQQQELPRGAGITGRAARPVTAQMQHVVTTFPLAEDVFCRTSVVKYWRMTHRAFGDGFADLRPNAQGALVSLVYNRGAGMQGGAREEMRTMRDRCIPSQDYPCLAQQMRAMKRVWRGKDIERGMSTRRDAEAALIETP